MKDEGTYIFVLHRMHRKRMPVSLLLIMPFFNIFCILFTVLPFPSLDRNFMKLALIVEFLFHCMKSLTLFSFNLDHGVFIHTHY